ncbi:hypothetical protein, partial [Shouchella miscanthi]|nr:hypothetical protein [Shouchella miscanthi]
EKVSFFLERKAQKSCASTEASQTKKMAVKYEHDKKEQQEKTSKGSSVHAPVRRKGCFRKSFMGSIVEQSTRGTTPKKTTLKPRDVARQ